MEHELTVSELARAVAPTADAAEISRIIRQLRHWTLTGVLSLAGTVHTGAGRHRKYSGDAIYVAAVMVELARMGLPVGGLWLVSASIAGLLKVRSSPLWEEAIKGDRQVYATIRILFDARKGDVVLHEAGAPDVSPPLIEGLCSAIVVDLTKLFGQIKL